MTVPAPVAAHDTVRPGRGVARVRNVVASGIRRPSPRATIGTASGFRRRSSRPRRPSPRLVAASLALTVGTGAALAPAAVQAKTIPITENVRLSLVKKTGTSFVHRGTAKGTYAGSVSSQMKLNSLSISGTVTIRTKGGSVRLKINGRARSSGLRSKFDGSATIAGGTGKFTKARGTGKFTGVVNRRTWAATIDAKGSMRL